MSNPLLTRLGVPEEVQLFFHMEEQLRFAYGNDIEEYREGFHRVPTTSHLWLAGAPIATEVVLVPSAMEAVAYLTLNRHRHPNFHQLTCIALGNRPSDQQIRWIIAHFPKSRFTLVFPDDLLGHLTDLRVATALQGKKSSFYKIEKGIIVQVNHLIYQFNGETISLSAFEKATGLRTQCRTRKPKHFTTFLTQLQHDTHS